MITLIHGPAELLRTEALAQIRAGIADDPDLADLNTARMDGRQTAIPEIQNACDTMPFLAQRRMVVVDGLLGRMSAPPKSRAPGPEQASSGEPALEEAPPPETGKSQSKALLAYLDHVPESSELVLMEEQIIGGGPILRRLLELQQDGRARIITCARPKKGDLPAWIRTRANLRKVKLNVTAIADLAEFVGDDLRQLDQELIKLADYAAGGKEVSSADVRRLVPATRTASVFDLVDALGAGNMPSAGKLMQHALDVDGEHPLRLLTMIGRQYRLLIQVKALQAAGAKPPEIARTLNVADWTAPKLLTQAGKHSFARLQRAMELVLAADEAIKTGRMGDREALDILLAELLQPYSSTPTQK
jgi:DNA polymerase III subunit delta